MICRTASGLACRAVSGSPPCACVPKAERPISLSPRARPSPQRCAQDDLSEFEDSREILENLAEEYKCALFARLNTRKSTLSPPPSLR